MVGAFWLTALRVIVLLVALSLYCGSRINIDRFLAARRLSQSAGPRLHRHRAATAATQARRLHTLRSRRQSPHAGAYGQGTTRHSFPGGERHAATSWRARRAAGRSARLHHSSSRRCAPAPVASESKTRAANPTAVMSEPRTMPDRNASLAPQVEPRHNARDRDDDIRRGGRAPTWAITPHPPPPS